MSSIPSVPATFQPTAPTPGAGASSHLSPAAAPAPTVAPTPSTAPSASSGAGRPPTDRTELQRQLDEVLSESDTSLRFRVDEESQRVVISVLDGSGELVMQIPDEAALAVARHLAKTGTLLSAKA